MRPASGFAPGLATTARLAALLALGLPHAAQACRCADNGIGVGYARAHAVVTGRVETVRGIEPAGVGSGSVASVRVGAAWKHAMPASVEVATQTTCAFDWKAGTTYVLAIFLEADGRFSTARCLGNRPLPAKAAVAWLRRHGRPEVVAPN